MSFKVERTFFDESGKKYQVGDVVTIKFHSGGGNGGCRITKITDKGFHYNQGHGRDKSVSFTQIAQLG